MLNKPTDRASSSPDTIDAIIAGQSLYESYFGLKEKPFKLTPDPKYLFMSKEHQEALAHLVFGIQENKGFVTITGEVGTGKTTLCRSFLNHLEKNIKVAYIFNPCLTDVELLQSINDELSIPSNSESKKRLIDELNKYLLKEKRQGNKVILVIDEAQNLTPKVLEQLRLLSNLETDVDKLIQIILIGQPELDNILSRPDLRQLKQRITIDWELLPLNKDETSSYIKHRISVAGGNGQLTFARNAIDKIYTYSKGVPRLINVIADRALIIAFTLDKKKINSKIIQYAIKDIERKKRRLPNQSNKFTKGNMLSGFLFLAFLFIGVIHHLSQKNIDPFINETASVKTISQPDIETKAKNEAVGNKVTKTTLSPPEEPTVIEAPIIKTRQSFNDFLNTIADQSQVDPIIEILKVWDLPPLSKDELPNIRFSHLHKKRELSFFRLETDLQQLKLINYPAVLVFQTDSSDKSYFLLLTGVQKNKLTFLSKGEKVDVLPQVANEAWTGIAYVFWKNFKNIAHTLKRGSRGYEVGWLSKRLKELGYYNQGLTNVFSNKLKNSVIQFQKEQLLKVDGVVGKVTKIILYNKTGNYKTPKLTKITG